VPKGSLHDLLGLRAGGRRAQARTLMALLHVYYSDPASFLHVHRFNHEPGKFSYDEVLRDLGHPIAA